ncbi:tetratricopeptide repeat protein, partial [Candidatus Poribacteria bacterium]|nr:tetratricopeptide repeat protein [Candidatus Poribacteria bacterium]
LRLAEHFFLNEDMAGAENALKNGIQYTEEWEQRPIERQLLNLYRYQGNLEEMLQKAEAEGTLTFEMQKQHAQYYHNMGDLEKATSYFKKAIEMTNSSFDRNEVANKLLNIYLKQDREDLVLAFYENEVSEQNQSDLISTTFSPSGITVRFRGDDTRRFLIDAYKERGKLQELRTLFERKLEEDATSRAVLELLADIYWETSDYKKAAETYHALGTVDPLRRRNILSFYHAAAAFHKSNQPDKVNAVLNQAENALASINDRHSVMSFYGSFATICLKNEMFAPAIKLAEKAVSTAETSGENWGLGYMYEILAKSYLGAKRYEDAFKTYQKMANVDSSSRHRAETGMKEAAKAGKLYERWIPEQLKQVTENPNDPEHILKLAQSYEAIEKTKEAITQYERLAELEPGNPQWHTKLGTLYQNLPQENRETGTGTEELNTKLSAKSINAYRKAIELERNSYQLYDLLAQTYLKVAQTSQAEAMYRHALDASLTQSDYDAAVRAIIRLYTADGQENTQIAILEEFKPRMDKSAVLHELLGDLYKKVGNSEKAELAYDKWLQIRQKELNIAQSASYYRNFAEKLLDKALYPETALFYAKRAFYKNTYYADDYFLTLGRACVANGLYDEALNHFKHALSLMFDEHYDEQYIDMLWEDIAEAIKIANDKERYIQMLNTLIDSMPAERSNAHAIIYHIIADFYAENETPAYVENYLLKTGFVPETSWITLGPFDNKDTIGLFTAYIPEETTQIDTAAQYYGKDKLIRWRKPDDGKRNGMIWLGSDIDWTAAYAWTIVSSPDEREITIRFDSDDQGIIWLNGIEVFRHDRMGGARVDRYTVPVTLKQGENTILIKVCNATLHTCFFMRLTDMHGNPFKDLKFNNADDLLNTLPPKPTFHVNVNLGLAEYYSKNNMTEKAMEL